MTTLSPTDSAFLWLETRNQPMHVAGLNIYSPPDGAGPDFVAKLLAQWGTYLQAVPPFNQRPARRMGLWHWEEDKEFELDYHLALNITTSGYGDRLGFGYTAMLDYTDESINELELALAAPPLVAARPAAARKKPVARAAGAQAPPAVRARRGAPTVRTPRRKASP